MKADMQTLINTVFSARCYHGDEDRVGRDYRREVIQVSLRVCEGFGIIIGNAGTSLSSALPGPKVHSEKGPAVELQEQTEATTPTALCAKLRSCDFILMGNRQLLKNVQQGSDMFRFAV